MITGDHPWTGESGVIVGYEILGLLPHLGPQARVKLDHSEGIGGHGECFVAPEKLARPGAPLPFMAAQKAGIKERNGPKEADNSIAEAARRREWIKLREAELDLAEREQQLIQLAAINAHIAGMIVVCRDRLTNMGAQLRDRLAQISDPIECQRLIDDEVNGALNLLAEYKPPPPDSK